jgi:hypothetical protein
MTRVQILALAICVAALASFSFHPAVALAGTGQFAVDAFLDDFDGNDIGQRTSFSPPGALLPIGPAGALVGPVTTGTVSGQFEFTCGDDGGDGFDPTDCAGPAFAAANFNWKWGVLKVVDAAGFPVIDAAFVEVAGDNFFPAAGPDEGFTFVETNGFLGNNPATRLAHFEFSIEDAGVTLEPGFEYIFFAGLTAEAIALGNRVPGEGVGFAGFAEESIYQTSVLEAPPYQFHQQPVAFTGILNQVATGRIVPIVPEPAAGLMTILGTLVILRRRAR